MLLDDELLTQQLAHKRYEPERSLSLRLTKNYLTFVTHLCRINLNEELYGEPQTKKRPKKHHKEPIWAKLVLVFYLYVTAKLSATLYYQYVLDFYKHRLDRFDQVLGSISTNLTTHHQQELKSLTRQTLVRDYEDARAVLKTIGSPYMNAHHLIENAYIFVIILVYIAYLQLQLYHRYISPFEYNIIYTFVAPERLQNSINKIISDIANNFIVSNRAYNKILIDQEANEATLLKWREKELRAKSQCAQQTGEHSFCFSDFLWDNLSNIKGSLALVRAKTIRVLRNHKLLSRDLKYLAMNGHFQPFNRRPEWLKTISRLYLIITIVTGVGCFICLVFFMLITPVGGILDFELETDGRDLIFHVEILFYISLGLTSSSFYVNLLTMKCIDQVYLVNKLKELIGECISTNTERLTGSTGLRSSSVGFALNPISTRRLSQIWCDNLALIDASTSSSGLVGSSANQKQTRNFINIPTLDHRYIDREEGLFNTDDFGLAYQCDNINVNKDLYKVQQVDQEINLRLLHTVLSYKIFVKQLIPVLDSFPCFVASAIFIMIIPAILTRLLTAYLSQTHRWVTLFVCLIALFGADTILVLVAMLHSYCLDIYRRLQSLMAHIIDMDDRVKARLGQVAYDEHLSWILRKELNHPDKLVDQFATRVFGSTMIYATLIKYHFWWGIIVVSFSVIDPNMENSSDYFGNVWRFYEGNEIYIRNLVQTTFNVTI